MNRLSALITAARFIIPKPIVGNRPVVQANPVKARVLRDALNDADQLAADLETVLERARFVARPYAVDGKGHRHPIDLSEAELNMARGRLGMALDKLGG